MADHEVPEEVRRRLCLVLDVDDIVAARRTARLLAPWFGTVKVGLELFSAAGPEAVTSFVEAGFDVFCDKPMTNSVDEALDLVADKFVEHRGHFGAFSSAKATNET